MSLQGPQSRKGVVCRAPVREGLSSRCCEFTLGCWDAGSSFRFFPGLSVSRSARVLGGGGGGDLFPWVCLLLSPAPPTSPPAGRGSGTMPCLCPQRSTQSPGTCGDFLLRQTFRNLHRDPPRTPVLTASQALCQGPWTGRRTVSHPHRAHEETVPGGHTVSPWRAPVGGRGTVLSGLPRAPACHAGGHTETTARPGASPAGEQTEQVDDGPGERGAGGEWTSPGAPLSAGLRSCPPHPAPPRCPLSSADTPTRLPEKIAC